VLKEQYYGKTFDGIGHRAWSIGSEVRSQRSEIRGQTTEPDNREFRLLNIEPQNDEVITSIRLRRILRFKETAAQMQ
jgi:hypothetical protein